MNLLTLISHDTTLRRTSAKHGGEFSGPCPFCRLGVDRFKVWPVIGRWACLGREAGRADLARDRGRLCDALGRGRMRGEHVLR